MSIAESKITAQGQISIPAKIRKKLGLAPGSVLEWYEQGCEVFVRRASKYTSKNIHEAIFSATPQVKSASDIRQGVQNRMRRKYERR